VGRLKFSIREDLPVIRCLLQNGRGLPLPQRISFVALRLQAEDSGFGGQRPPRPLAKQKRIVEKVDALMALADTFEQQLDDSRAAAELTAA
jgi:hypothetical protein